MEIENNIVKRYVPNYDSLIKYGFIKKENTYKYNKNLIDNFEVRITISNDKLTGKIIDLDFNEEYVNYRIEDQTGNFVGMIREKYIDLLNDIKDKCFISMPFSSKQANRISKLIYEKYNINPVFKWDKYNYGVFENNNKWFGLIADIDRSKISNLKGSVDVLNIKLSENKINNLLEKKGFYKAYHMNKKNWITITLDDSISDDKIMDLVDESYSYTVGFKGSSNEWVMPINPSYFDVFRYFDSTDLYYWDKKKSFKKDDIVYLYITKPIGAIMYKCMIKEFTNDFMIVKKLCKYNKDKYKLELLKKYGLTSVRSTRHIPIILSKFLNDEK